jgi:hypothetical protein
MSTDTTSLRLRPPAQGSLAAEVRALLNGAGLPCAEENADRLSAVGVLISPETDGKIDVEWLVSQTARATAAFEQTNGIPYGSAVLLHGEARRHVSTAIMELLTAMGYRCAWTPNGGFTVDAERQQGPTTLAADMKRFLAEQRRRLDLLDTDEGQAVATEPDEVDEDQSADSTE